MSQELLPASLFDARCIPSPAGNITGINIYRAAGTGTPVKVGAATISGNAFSYADSGLASGALQTGGRCCVDTAGEAPMSNLVAGVKSRWSWRSRPLGTDGHQCRHQLRQQRGRRGASAPHRAAQARCSRWADAAVAINVADDTVIRSMGRRARTPGQPIASIIACSSMRRSGHGLVSHATRRMLSARLWRRHLDMQRIG